METKVQSMMLPAYAVVILDRMVAEGRGDDITPEYRAAYLVTTGRALLSLPDPRTDRATAKTAQVNPTTPPATAALAADPAHAPVPVTAPAVEPTMSPQPNPAPAPTAMSNQISNRAAAAAQPTPTRKIVPPLSEDKLITFREVNEKIGSACKTAHTALNLARRGLIRAVRVNSRVVRYSSDSVAELVAGRLKS